METPVKTKKMSKVDFVRLIMQDPRQTQYFQGLEKLYKEALNKNLYDWNQRKGRYQKQLKALEPGSKEAEKIRDQEHADYKFYELILNNLYRDKVKPQERLITKVCNIRIVDGKISYFATEPVAYGLTPQEKREILNQSPPEEEAEIIELIQNKKHKLFRVWSKIPLKYRGQEDSDAFLKWMFKKIIVNPVIAQLYLAEQNNTFKRYS